MIFQLSMFNTVNLFFNISINYHPVLSEISIIRELYRITKNNIRFSNHIFISNFINDIK